MADEDKPEHGDGDRGISSLAVCGRLVCSGSYDQTVKIWEARRVADAGEGKVSWTIARDQKGAASGGTPYADSYSVKSREEITSISVAPGAWVPKLACSRGHRLLWRLYVSSESAGSCVMN